MNLYVWTGLVRLTLVVSGFTLASPFVRAEDLLVRIGSVQDAFAVRRAVEGAVRRLESPRCRGVLSDFRAADGTTLAEVLSRDGVTAPGHLRRLFFFSGEDRPQCRKDVLAWTAPGSRVVFICPARFRRSYATNPGRLEAVVLHEMLHTLGLGENPPTGAEITHRVVAACGV